MNVLLFGFCSYSYKYLHCAKNVTNLFIKIEQYLSLSCVQYNYYLFPYRDCFKQTFYSKK